jgi:prepilin-type N-terminal cleavage/methylation domain-containing protein
VLVSPAKGLGIIYMSLSIWRDPRQSAGAALGRLHQGKGRHELDQKGFTLIEVLIALFILAILGTACLLALQTSSRATNTANEQATAESLARAQMEYVKSQTYDGINNPPQYSQLPTAVIPYDYTINITAERIDQNGNDTPNEDGLQKITITINHHGKQIITLADYKGA